MTLLESQLPDLASTAPPLKKEAPEAQQQRQIIEKLVDAISELTDKDIQAFKETLTPENLELFEYADPAQKYRLVAIDRLTDEERALIKQKTDFFAAMLHDVRGVLLAWLTMKDKT